MRAGSGIVLLWLAACGSGAPRPPAAAACRADPALVAEADRQRADGYLAQALAAAEQAERGCSDPRTRRLLAEVLADIGLDHRAIDLYRGLGDAATVAELERRPSPTRQASADGERQAVLLYRDGVDARLRGHHALALRQLRRSYALRPHPLTIVQIGLVHKAAGDAVEHRKANARALTIAEELAGAPAMLVIRPSHQGEIRAVDASADGRWVLSADYRGAAMVWEAATGRQVWTGPARDGLTAFLDGGRTLACADGDGIALWDTRSWTREALDVRGVTALTAAASAAVLVTGDARGEVTLWRAGAAEARVRGCAGTRVQQLTVAASGAVIGITCRSGGYSIWRPAEGVTRWLALPDEEPRWAFAVAVDPGGTRVAAAGYQRVPLWDADGTLRGSAAIDADELHVSAVAFAADGRLAAKVSSEIMIWDAAGRLEHILRLDQERFVGAMTFTADGRLLTATDRGAIRMWDTEAGTQVRAFGGNATLTHIAVHPGGDQIAVGSSAGRVWRWDLRGGKRPFMFESTGEALVPVGLGFALGGEVLLIGHERGLLGHDAVRNKIHQVQLDPPLFIVLAMTSGDSTAVLTGGANRILTFRVDSPAALAGKLSAASDERRVGPMQSRPRPMALSTDQQLLATASDRGTVVWDLAANREVRRIDDARGPLVFHPRVQRLAGGRVRGGVGVWNEAGLLLPGPELVVGRKLTDLAFLPDGRLAAGTDDGRIEVEVAGPRASPLVLDSGAAVTALASHPRGAWLASTHRDGTMRLWDPDRGRLLATLIVTNEGSWLVTSGDRVTGTADSDLLYWQVGAYQLPGFVGWQRNHARDLLAELFPEPSR